MIVIWIIIISTLLLIFLCFIGHFFGNTRYIDLFDENVINKIKNYDIKYLKIIRRRRALGRHIAPVVNNEIDIEWSLEAEYPVPAVSPEDIIEVYGINKKNKEYLFYSTSWSLEEAKNLKNIVNKLNEEIKNNE
jgi:hypothetical protein